MNPTLEEIPPGADRATRLADRTPEQIESEIEGTRQRLRRTLDALEAKLSPRARLRSAADSAMRTGERWARRGADSMTPDITTMIRIDHTHVLALFRRFRPSASNSRKGALVANACLALEIHATLEEEIFYPALRAAGARSEALDKSVPEHNEMRALISAIRAMQPGDPAFDDTFRMLMRTVLHHVADEESIVLPEAEMLMPQQLGQLGMQMTRRRLELLKPHLAEVAVTTARSFPVATAAAAASLLAIGWLMFRPRGVSKH
jgi:hemerythrin superfamily protein